MRQKLMLIFTVCFLFAMQMTSAQYAVPAVKQAGYYFLDDIMNESKL